LQRLFDIAVSCLVLAIAGPALLVAALLVKLTSRGPAFYHGKRAGLGGRPFFQHKLRTMRVHDDRGDRKITDLVDDRITPVGAFLRKVKLDELPQFWNVLVGEMSIVGPRPEDFDLVQEHYTAEQMRTLEVRPGITSQSMVTWYPDETYHDPPPDGVSMQEHYLRRHLPVKLQEELDYLRRRTFWSDLGVIWRTFLCVVLRSWRPPVRRPFPAPPHVGAPD
jgi:lipopolysaccharide/colanic/teichoic acid biosynthesis glycosyltransferase